MPRKTRPCPPDTQPESQPLRNIPACDRATMTTDHHVANSSRTDAATSLSPLTQWFTHDPLVPTPEHPPKPPPIPPANEFLRSARERLGRVSQNYLADWIKADRSMVGRWEMEDGSDPSWRYVGRILVLLNVLDATGKLLCSPTQAVQSAPMTIADHILEELAKLSQDEQLAILRLVTRRATETQASQTPAALKKG